MALHLVTGYAGTEHITSADQGAYNMGTFGEGEYVLDRGNKFEATVVSNNLITLADGEALMQGRFIKMISGTTEEVPIENGTQEMNRNDLICIRYEKNSTTSIESASIVVKKGTETSGTPADPEYVTGEITDGNDLVNEMPLYRVQLQGLNIASVTALAETMPSMIDFIENYSLQPATADILGGVKIGSNINVTSDGKISTHAPYSLPTASSWTKGGVLVSSSSSSGIRINSNGKLFYVPPSSSTVNPSFYSGETTLYALSHYSLHYRSTTSSVINAFKNQGAIIESIEHNINTSLVCLGCEYIEATNSYVDFKVCFYNHSATSSVSKPSSIIIHYRSLTTETF